MTHGNSNIKEPHSYLAPSCVGKLFQGAEFQITGEIFKTIHLLAIRPLKLP